MSAWRKLTLVLRYSWSKARAVKMLTDTWENAKDAADELLWTLLRPIQWILQNTVGVIVWMACAKESDWVRLERKVERRRK